MQGAGRRPWGQLLAKAVLGKQQQLQGWLPVLGRTWNVAWWHGRGYSGDVVCPQRSTGSKKACKHASVYLVGRSASQICTEWNSWKYKLMAVLYGCCSVF